MRISQQLITKVTLSPKRLKMAGWLSLASSLLTLPWFLFTYNLANRDDIAIKTAKAAMMVGRLALLIYLLLIFQQLLNRRFGFYSANPTISLLVQASIIQVFAAIIGLAIPELHSAVLWFGLVMLVIIGILHIMFGAWLLRLPASLGGMHRPFCYLSITTGVAFATIVLLPLGMFTSTVADIMLGTIFLQSTRMPPTTA